MYRCTNLLRSNALRDGGHVSRTKRRDSGPPTEPRVRQGGLVWHDYSSTDGKSSSPFCLKDTTPFVPQRTRTTPAIYDEECVNERDRTRDVHMNIYT